MKHDLKHLEKKEIDFFNAQRIEHVEELLRLAETLKDDEKMENWRQSRHIFKEKIDKIFNCYEFFLSYSSTKKQINNIK